MAGRGPVPDPPRLAKAKGSKRAAGRKAKVARPSGRRPKCPAWLDAEAKKKFRQLLPELERLGVLDSADEGAIAVYCQAWGDLKTAVETLQKDGLTVAGGSGGVKAHPALAAQRAAANTIRLVGSQLGLSPEGRQRLRIELDDATDELAVFLGPVGPPAPAPADEDDLSAFVEGTT